VETMGRGRGVALRSKTGGGNGRSSLEEQKTGGLPRLGDRGYAPPLYNNGVKGKLNQTNAGKIGSKRKTRTQGSRSAQLTGRRSKGETTCHEGASANQKQHNGLGSNP